MKKRESGSIPLYERALLDDRNLAIYLDVGLHTAREISTKAGAVRHFGKLKRNDRQAIDEYLRSMN